MLWANRAQTSKRLYTVNVMHNEYGLETGSHILTEKH